MDLIIDYASLQAAIAAYLNRADLTADIKVFIQLAERDIRRNLRDAVARGSLTLDAVTETLPVFVKELLSLRFNTDTRQYPLKRTTPENLASMRRVGSGVPLYYAVLNGEVLLDITPDTSYACETTYVVELTELSDSDTSNTTLLNSPDIYLFGALKESAPYLEHDERNILWSQKYQKAVADENEARERAELSGGPVVARLPIRFG
jgi:hypothetical protein